MWIDGQVQEKQCSCQAFVLNLHTNQQPDQTNAFTYFNPFTAITYTSHAEHCGLFFLKRI